MSTTSEARPPVGEFVRAPKTAELIATHLRGQIVRGQLKAGQTLPSENELMDQYGVSRPTLREAFRILETENLITVRRGSRGGAHVMAPDISVAARYVGVLLQIQGTTITDVYEARLVFEPPCAGLLAARRTEEDLADLTSVVDELESTLDTASGVVPEPAAWSRLSNRFHELVMQRCGNNTLAVQGAVLQDIVRTHMRARADYFNEPEPPDRFRRAVRAYRRLITHIEAGDSAAAERHWRRHMEAASEYLLKDDLKNKPVVDLFG